MKRFVSFAMIAIAFTTLSTSCNRPQRAVQQQSWDTYTSPAGTQYVQYQDGTANMLMEYMLFSTLMNSGGINSVYNYAHTNPTRVIVYNPSTYSSWKRSPSAISSSSFRSTNNNTPPAKFQSTVKPSTSTTSSSSFRSSSTPTTSYKPSTSSSGSSFRSSSSSSSGSGGSSFRSSSSSSSSSFRSSSSGSSFRSSSSSRSGRY